MPQHNHCHPMSWYRRHRDEIIALAVRWYISYQLSLRDLVEMLSDRGLDVHPSTIWRCV
jgi:IS6 family transposase